MGWQIKLLKMKTRWYPYTTSYKPSMCLWHYIYYYNLVVNCLVVKADYEGNFVIIFFKASNNTAFLNLVSACNLLQTKKIIKSRNTYSILNNYFKKSIIKNYLYRFDDSNWSYYIILNNNTNININWQTEIQVY